MVSPNGNAKSATRNAQLATRNSQLGESDLGSLSQWQLIRIRFAKHRMALYSLYVILALYGIALFAEFFAPTTKQWNDIDFIFCPPQLPRFSFEHGFYVVALEKQKDPITLRRYFTKDPDHIIPLGFLVKGEPYELCGLVPMERHFFGLKHHAEGETFCFLGADKFGQDVFSRIIYGSRISLSIGLVSIIATFILGIVVGGISGYIGGRVDNLIQRFIEIVNSFPQIPLWLILAAILPADWSPLRMYFAITIVLSLLTWTGLARVVRGKLLSLREEDYAVAALLIGAGHGRIIFRHLVPGFLSHIIVALTLSVPGMILGETALSFLALGLRPPVVSWGVMLQDCIKFQIITDHPWILMPVLFIVLTVLSFNFLGDGLRDAADPYSVN